MARRVQEPARAEAKRLEISSIKLREEKSEIEEKGI